MKDVSRKVANQTDEFLTPREDLTFYDDDSISDSAFHSDFSNGSAPDLAKYSSSDVAVAYERNLLKDWTGKLSCRCTHSCITSCDLHWSREEPISYSDRREYCSKDLITQSSFKQDPTVFEESSIDWENVSSLCAVSPDLSRCKLHDEDARTQHSNISREGEQCDGVIHELQRERHLLWNLTHESLKPITEWQRLKELECDDSDNGISDVESEESDVLWSPSPEDVPLVRPEFVPKLDLSWVFEDENRKQKRSGKRAAAQSRTEKGPEKVSIISDSSKLAETRIMKDKAESLLSECFEEVSHSKWQHKDRSQDESTDAAQYRNRHNSVGQALAHKLPANHCSNNVNKVASACIYDNAQMSLSPEMLDRTIWLPETSKDEEIFQQQSRRSLSDRCWPPENINCETYFDRIMSQSRPSNPCYPFQTSHNSRAMSFNCGRLQEHAKSCPSESYIEDYKQSEQQETYEELAEGSLCVNDTTTASYQRKASYSYATISRPPVFQLPKYYVVDERDSQLRDMRQRLVPQYEQETVTRAIQPHTVLETDCYDSNTYRLDDDPPNKDLHFVKSRTSDSELDVDTNNDLKLAKFIEINARTTDSGQEKELGEQGDDEEEEDEEDEEEEEDADEEEYNQNTITTEPKLEELYMYDVEAAVVRHGRKQKLAKFVCCFIGCQFLCCQQRHYRPCYCDWKCDAKCFR